MGKILGLMGWLLLAFTSFWVAAEFGAAIGLVYFLSFSGACFWIPAMVSEATEAGEC